MRAIARARTSTLATSLMRVKKIAVATSVCDTCCVGYWRKWKKIKNFKLNDYSEYYNQFGIYQTFSCTPFLEPRQNNLSNPEAYSEFSQTFKMEWLV